MFHVASLKDEAECWVSREGIADEDMWMQYTVSRHFYKRSATAAVDRESHRLPSTPMAKEHGNSSEWPKGTYQKAEILNH